MVHDRRPLVASELGRAPFVTGLTVVTETTSTNSDLTAAARAGAAEGTVLIAEFQHAGRGRFARTWASPRGAGLTFSILVRPTSVDVSRWGWLPLLTGLAVRDAIGAVLPATDVALKWPNDVLLGPAGGKVAGILAEAGAGWVVVGIGLNVHTRADELPSEQATSVGLHADAPVSRAQELEAVLAAFGARYADWCAAGGDPVRSGVRAAYEQACATLGREVEVRHPDRTELGRAVEVDASGALVVETADGRVVVSAGDIVHIRPRDR